MKAAALTVSKTLKLNETDSSAIALIAEDEGLAEATLLREWVLARLAIEQNRQPPASEPSIPELLTEAVLLIVGSLDETATESDIRQMISSSSLGRYQR